MNRKYLILLFLFFLSAICEGHPVKSFQQSVDGITVFTLDGTLGIYPVSENAVRVRFYRNADALMPELIFTPGNRKPVVQVSDSPSTIEVNGGKLLSCWISKQVHYHLQIKMVKYS